MMSLLIEEIDAGLHEVLHILFLICVWNKPLFLERFQDILMETSFTRISWSLGVKRTTILSSSL